MSFKYTVNALKKMEQLLEEADYTVRYERGNFKAGFCILEDRRVAVINKFLSVEGRINALIDMLPNIKIEGERLSTEMQKWFATVKNSVTLGQSPETHQTEMPL